MLLFLILIIILILLIILIFKYNSLDRLNTKNFNYALKLRCNGIHTFFMKEKIDVILTDKDNKILKIYYALKLYKENCQLKKRIKK